MRREGAAQMAPPLSMTAVLQMNDTMISRRLKQELERELGGDHSWENIIEVAQRAHKGVQEKVGFSSDFVGFS